MNAETTQPLVTEYSGGMIAWLVIYALLFITGIVYISINGKKHSLPAKLGIVALAIISLITFFIKLSISEKGWEFTTDIGCFTGWSERAAKNLTQFYNTDQFCDYPPLYIYILAFFGKITQLGVPSEISVRLPVLFSEIIIACFIYKFATKKISNTAGLILSALWLANPLVILDCAIWGQMDAVLTAFIVAAVYFLDKENYIISAALFTGSILIKPQGLFFLPVFIFTILKRRQWMQLIWAPLTAILVTFVIVFPFAKDNFIPAESAFVTGLPGGLSENSVWLKIASVPVLKDFMWLGNLYTGTASTYNYISLNMANFWSMFNLNTIQDNTLANGIPYSTWGIIFIIFVIALVGIYVFRSKNENTSWFACAILNIGIVMLATRMHERYMFPIIGIMFIVFIFTRDWITPILTLGLTITNYLNVSEVLIRYQVTGSPHIYPGESEQFVAVSAFNTLILAIILVILVYQIRNNSTLLPMKYMLSDVSNKFDVFARKNKKQTLGSIHKKRRRK